MRRRIVTALLFTTFAVGPAVAQQQPADQARGGVTTETESRAANVDNDYNPLWDYLGLVGLVGLLGLWKPSDNDGYTDDPI